MVETTWGRNLKALREDRGLLQDDLAEQLGVTQTTVSGWESRGTTIRKGNLQKLMNFFGVSADAILSNAGGYFAETRGISAPDVLKPIKLVSSSPAVLPLCGRVHAGDAQDPDLLDELIPVPAEIAERHPNAYLLLVEGDCMSRVYPEGSLIAIDPDLTPQNGSIAVVSIDGADYIMRRLYKGASTLVLSPDSYNDEWEDIIIGADDERTVEYHGVVVWYQAPREMW